MSGSSLDQQLVSTYYTYVLIFFAALAAVSVAKLLVRRGRERRAIR